MLVVGIDPGQDGGIVAIKNGLIYKKFIMPKSKNYRGGVDITGLVEILNELQNDDENIIKFYLEEVWAQPKNGTRHAFSFGINYGIIYAVLATIGATYYNVLPKEWQKIMPVKRKKPKEAATESVKRLFPKEDFLLSKRRVNPHQGLVDATMIAYYGTIKELEKKGER